MESNENVKHLTPQEFLEDFQKRETKQNPFVYGFGRRQPFSTFLFKVPNKSGSPLFNCTWYDTTNFPTASQSIINQLHTESKQKCEFSQFNYFSMVVSAAEIFSAKISPLQSKCVLCNAINTQEAILKHIIQIHSEQLTNLLEPHSEYLSDDTEFMTGMLTKLQFDSEIPIPSKLQVKKPQIGIGITAPILNFHEIDDNYDFDDDDYEDYSEEDSDSIGGVQTKPDAMHPITSLDYLVKAPPIILDGYKNAPLTYFLDKHPQNLMKRFAIDYNPELEQLPSAQSIFMPFCDSYLKNPQKSAAMFNDLSIFENENQKSSNQVGSKRKQKQPELVSYLSTIPEPIKNEIIARIAKKVISNWVSSQLTDRILKPVIQRKKKEDQKKLRDQKINKAKIEEKQKLQAMRERRKVKIDQMTDLIIKPILRSFIHSEVETIFSEVQADLNQKTEVAASNTNLNEDEGIDVTSHPIVVSGLNLMRHCNAQFILDTFSQLQFELDENMRPKIRFRLHGNRIEALLFLASQYEIRKALSQNPIFVDSCTLNLSLDLEDVPTFKLFTSQEILLFPNVKNIEKITADGGKMLNEDIISRMLMFDDNKK